MPVQADLKGDEEEKPVALLSTNLITAVREHRARGQDRPKGARVVLKHNENSMSF